MAHVLRVARRSVKHSIFKDTAADPFHGSCVHRHGALNRFFSLLEVHVCGSPEAEGCFDARFSEYMYVFFVICALGLAFSSLRAVGACSTFFFFLCVQWMRVPSFFMHGTPAACAERCERRAALPVEKWRELEL